MRKGLVAIGVASTAAASIVAILAPTLLYGAACRAPVRVAKAPPPGSRCYGS